MEKPALSVTAASGEAPRVSYHRTSRPRTGATSPDVGDRLTVPRSPLPEPGMTIESLPEHIRRPHVRPIQPIPVSKDGKQFIALPMKTGRLLLPNYSAVKQ